MYFVVSFLITVLCLPFDAKGPQFTHEPPTRLHFSNDTGGKIDCIAIGTPAPVIEWIVGMLESFKSRFMNNNAPPTMS